MDRNGVWRFHVGSGRHGWVERYCCNVICGALTTSEVKGLRWDECQVDCWKVRTKNAYLINFANISSYIISVLFVFHSIETGHLIFAMFFWCFIWHNLLSVIFRLGKLHKNMVPAFLYSWRSSILTVAWHTNKLLPTLFCNIYTCHWLSLDEPF